MTQGEFEKRLYTQDGILIVTDILTIVEDMKREFPKMMIFVPPYVIEESCPEGKELVNFFKGIYAWYFKWFGEIKE